MKPFPIDQAKIVIRPCGGGFTSHYPNPRNESMGFRRNFHSMGSTEAHARENLIHYLEINGGVMPAEVQSWAQ